MSKSLQFIADTIDGEIQPVQGVFNFPCDKVTPIGVNIVRSFDDDLGIIAKRVFVIEYNNHSFGSTQFKSLNDFNQYYGISCKCCPSHCIVLVNGCNLTLNGCNLVSDEPMINECDILVNGCNVGFN